MKDAMNTDLTNFREWYAEPLNQMYPRRESGIAVLMLSIPLLERYLRHKNGLINNESLDDACMTDLCAMFGTLVSKDVARQFWSVFRNGFLHQATFSLQARNGNNYPTGILSHDYLVAVEVSAGEFHVNPELFSKCVINAIEQNFAVFSGSAVPLPTVKKYKSIPATGGGLNPYEGTSAALTPNK